MVFLVLTAIVLLSPVHATGSPGGACADIAALARTWPGLTVHESTGAVRDDRTGAVHDGCRVAGSGEGIESRDNRWPHDLLLARMRSQGWREEISRDADGAGSTAFALRRDDSLCLFSAIWEGGDAADPAGFAAGRYELEIGCFTLPTDDGSGGAATVASADAPAPPTDEQRKRQPCLHDERFREFDFWIGEWEVANADGKQVGRNSIRADAGGCMLLESWKGAGGSVGSSINFIDPASGRWKQVWVDGSGGLIEIEGGLEDGAMRLVGTHSYADGRVLPFRGTWTPLPDGRVRQHFEESADGGASWPTWFDGYYSRRGE